MANLEVAPGALVLSSCAFGMAIGYVIGFVNGRLESSGA